MAGRALCHYSLDAEGSHFSLISPHAMRAPALPVVLEVLPFVPGSEWSPVPRSSGSACTITERPMTLKGPSSFTRASTKEPLDA
eukprot:4933874-Pyramimonas_sp.AAC.1